MSVVPGGGPVLRPVAAGTTRRTTTIQMTPHGAWNDGQAVTAVARDLARNPDGATRATEERLFFDVDPAGLIVPDPIRRTVPEGLRGLSAQRGLRKAVARLRTELAARGDDSLGTPGDLVDTLLDDLVGTSLASGYGRLYEGTIHPDGGRIAASMRLTCIGFNTMDRRGEQFDVQRYFETKPPSVEFVTGDPLAWHEDPPMPPSSFRRRRMLEVTPDAEGRVGATGYFRDTFMRPDGVEMVVHEYGLEATLSGDPLVLDRVHASPGNLPLDHCPLAAASALRLEGLPLAEVEETVRREVGGPTGCTHLNDELRSLRLVRSLLGLTAPRGSRGPRR